MKEDCYCMRCRDTVGANGEIITAKNGRPMFKGTCPICKTKVFKFMRAKE